MAALRPPFRLPESLNPTEGANTVVHTTDSVLQATETVNHTTDSVLFHKISFVDGYAQNTGNTNPSSITLNTSNLSDLAVGDVMIAAHFQPSGVPTVSCSGWTHIRTAHIEYFGEKGDLQTFWHVATASDAAGTATHQFNTTHSDQQALCTLVYRGVDTTTPVHQSSGTGSRNTGEVVTCPTLTTTVNYCHIVRFGGVKDRKDSGWTTGTTYSSSSAAWNGQATIGGYVGVELATAGSAGTYAFSTMTQSNSEWTAQTVALLPAHLKELHTTDAVLQATEQVTHTTDSVLQATETVNHTTDSVLSGQATIVHTTDSVLQATEEAAHTTDAVVGSIKTVDHATDTVLQATEETTHTTDAALVNRATVVHTTDSVLQATEEAAHTTDAVLQGTEEGGHTTNAVLQSTVTVDHDTDTQLVSRATVVHTTDAWLSKTVTISTLYMTAASDLEMLAGADPENPDDPDDPAPPIGSTEQPTITGVTVTRRDGTTAARTENINRRIVRK